MRLHRLTLLAIPAFVGCYRYVPIVTPAPAIGSEFRSHLTPQGSETLATTLGRNIEAFDGRLLSEDRDQYRFAVTQTKTMESRFTSWSGEAITLPRSTIARMELKVLDRKRTLRAVGLSIGGAVLGGLVFAGLSGAGSGGSGGPGPIPP